MRIDAAATPPVFLYSGCGKLLIVSACTHHERLTRSELVVFCLNVGFESHTEVPPKVPGPLHPPQPAHSGCCLVSSRVGDADFADLAEEVSKAQEVEAAPVPGVAVQTREDAELRIVLPIVDQLPSVRAFHLPDQLAVQKQLV